MEGSAKMSGVQVGFTDNKRQKGINFKYLAPTMNTTALIKEENYHVS